MKKLSSFLKLVTAICFLVGFNHNLFADEVVMQVSPSVINIEAAGENNVTIHADISYSLVDTEALEVHLKDSKGEVYEVPILATYQDGRFELVIKTDWVNDFLVKYEPEKGKATFYLDGALKADPDSSDPTPVFAGEDTVEIIYGPPKK